MRLESFSLPKEQLIAGDTLPVILNWRTLNTITRDYTVFVHLTGDDRQPLAQHDSQPAQAERSVSSWQVGELVADLHPLVIPDDLPPGRYQLWAGIYSFDGEDVIRDGIESGTLTTQDDDVLIGTILVAGKP
jgi:hypothetical protein